MTYDADFYEVVKFVDNEPEFDEERLQQYLDQGMWPDKPQEHVAYYQSEENAEKRRERMKNSSDTHRDELSDEEGGWMIAIKPCDFEDK
jgi:hypothetical protein